MGLPWVTRQGCQEDSEALGGQAAAPVLMVSAEGFVSSELGDDALSFGKLSPVRRWASS